MSERRLKQGSCTSSCSLMAGRRADERGGFGMEEGDREVGAAGGGGMGSA